MSFWILGAYKTLVCECWYKYDLRSGELEDECLEEWDVEHASDELDNGN